MLTAEQGEQASEWAAVDADISPLLRGGEAEEGAAGVPAEPAGWGQPAPEAAGGDGGAADGAGEGSRGEGGHGGQPRQGEGPAEEGTSACLPKMPPACGHAGESPLFSTLKGSFCSLIIICIAECP